MADGKKSIVIYSDWENIFKQLDDNEAGRLIKYVFDYVNDRDPILEDRLLKMAFEPIKMQLKRDLVKWEDIKKKRSESGSKGGFKSGESRNNNKQSEANEANASNVKQNEANEAVNVPVNVNVNVPVNVPVNENVPVIYSYWNLLKNDLLNSQSWHESFCMNKKIELSKMIELLNEFISNCEASDDTKRTLSEYKKHFVNWVNTRPEKKQTNTNKEIGKIRYRTHGGGSHVFELPDNEQGNNKLRNLAQGTIIYFQQNPEKLWEWTEREDLAPLYTNRM